MGGWKVTYFIVWHSKLYIMRLIIRKVMLLTPSLTHLNFWSMHVVTGNECSWFNHHHWKVTLILPTHAVSAAVKVFQWFEFDSISEVISISLWLWYHDQSHLLCTVSVNTINPIYVITVKSLCPEIFLRRIPYHP